MNIEWCPLSVGVCVISVAHESVVEFLGKARLARELVFCELIEAVHVLIVLDSMTYLDEQRIL